MNPAPVFCKEKDRTTWHVCQEQGCDLPWDPVRWPEYSKYARCYVHLQKAKDAMGKRFWRVITTSNVYGPLMGYPEESQAMDAARKLASVNPGIRFYLAEITGFAFVDNATWIDLV